MDSSTSRHEDFDGLNAPLPSRTEVVAARLRSAISEGQLGAGEKLDLNELARKFGVSRMPVRDALKILEAEGLVRIYPYRGIEVSRLDRQDIEELFGLRQVLEHRAALRAVPRLSERDLAVMATLLEEMDTLLQDRDQDRWLDLNGRFHAVINNACGWPRLIEMISVLRTNVERYVRAYVRERGRDEPQRQHRAIYQGCRDRDPEKVAAIITEHLRDTADALLRTVDAESGRAKSPTGLKTDHHAKD